MFSTAGKQSVTLDNFGGLITQAPPESLPEGASPLTYDCDFPIAAVTTRPGLQPVLNSGVARNFVWVKTFTTNDGTVRTLCLDAGGTLWQENVTANPGNLTQINQFTAGDYAKGTSAFNREYILLASPNASEYDNPWQYDGTNFDRISQEGPGATGLSFTPASSPNQATITAFSITSNVVTFTAANNFTSGTIIQVTGLSVGTYLNGAVLTVSATGLSGSQFEAAFTHANVTSTADSGTAAAVTSFPIASITQPAAVSIGGASEWSSGQRAKTAGTTITVYYSNTAPDTNITLALQKGIPVYVYVTGQPSPFPAGTFQITSVGESPAGGTSWYFFSYNAPSSNYAYTGGPPTTGTYQVTLAQVVTSEPVPGIAIGGQVSILGASPSSWNNSWSVLDTAQSGVLSINETSMVPGSGPAGGVATYTFTQVSGSAPVTGDFVTVQNTNNGNGVFNVTNATISGVSGSTFTVSGFAPQTIAAQPETGGAQTFGKYFTIDPGPQFVNSPGSSSPIFGNAGAAGTVTALGTTLSISGGTRQAIVLFQTRNNGYWTKASPPITFTTSGQQQSITATNIPLGPPNCTGRVIAFTEAGANEVPGGFFYVIENPVPSVVNGQPYTYSSTVINDNVTTSATFTFTDAILLASTEIDIPGANQFNLRELGSSRWSINYASRMFYGLEQNKVTNFVNMTFNGGYQGGTPFPLGWTQDPNYGAGSSLIVSSEGDGNSLQIINSTTTNQTVTGMITQPAFQDAYGVPIILPNTQYGIRIRARAINSSGTTTPTIQVALITLDQRSSYYGSTQGAQINVTFGPMTTQIATLTPSTTGYATVPQNLILRVLGYQLQPGQGVEIGRLEIFPLSQPVLSQQVAASYINEPEAIDNVTGQIGLAGRNNQACPGGFVMYDQLYFLKTGSMFVTRDSPGDEPSEWDVHEVSNTVGTAGIWSYDVGEEWMVTACRQGGYIFTGGSPTKITQEIQQLWDSINWSAGYSLVTKVDIQNRRILFNVPLPTPNQWLPNAPVNANPTTPNVQIVLNYVGCGSSPMELANSPQMHTTMFGNLVSPDMRRKWNIWQIPSPYMDFIQRGDGQSKPLFVCNGIGSGKIYQLSSTQFSDDGAAINSTYCTYGFVNSGMSKQNPLLGFHRKLFTYLQLLAYGAGVLTVKFLANTLNADINHTWTVLGQAGGIQLQANPPDDIERSINIAGNRVFMQFSTNAVGAHFTVSKAILVGGVHPMLPLRGSNSA